jgi:hypothetical protein
MCQHTFCYVFTHKIKLKKKKRNLNLGIESTLNSYVGALGTERRVCSMRNTADSQPEKVETWKRLLAYHYLRSRKLGNSKPE